MHIRCTPASRNMHAGGQACFGVMTSAARRKSSEHSFAVATTRNALEAGYRHLDCAPVYGNEALVGEAIGPWLKEHGRDSLFLTSKVWNDAHRPQLLRCVHRSKRLLCTTGVLCKHETCEMRLVQAAGPELLSHSGAEVKQAHGMCMVAGLLHGEAYVVNPAVGTP